MIAFGKESQRPRPPVQVDNNNNNLPDTQNIEANETSMQNPFEMNAQ